MKFFNSSRVSTLTRIALSSALLCIFSLLSFPTPSGIPITLSTLIVAICSYTYGAIVSSTAVLVYIALGAIGLPVFASFSGGIGILASITGGFIIGYAPYALICGIRASKPTISLLLGAVGILACHIIGVTQYALITRTGFIECALISSLPYLFKDIVCVVIAYVLSVRLRKALKI